MQPPLILPCQFKDFFCDNDPTHLTVIYIVCSSSLLLSVLPSSLSGTFISRRENKLCINESAAVLRSSKPSPAMTNWLPRKLGGCQPGRTCKHIRLSHTYTHMYAQCYSTLPLPYFLSHLTRRAGEERIKRYPSSLCISMKRFTVKLFFLVGAVMALVWLSRVYQCIGLVIKAAASGSVTSFFLIIKHELKANPDKHAVHFQINSHFCILYNALNHIKRKNLHRCHLLLHTSLDFFILC